MQYVCLFYFDPQVVFNQSAESRAVLAAVRPHEEELKASGHMITSRALTLPNEAVTVRVRDGKMSAIEGPFTEAKEVLGGFAVIEARDLNDAVSVAARFPLAKLGSVEVRAVVFGVPDSPVVA
jgi:hypothetical protein